MYNIVVVGLGHVGLPYALCLALKNIVTVFDIDQSAVKDLNAGKLPIDCCELQKYFRSSNLKISAVSDDQGIYEAADYVILATPTNYDESNEWMDTSSLTKIAREVVAQNYNAKIVIKSTVPVGYTAWLSNQLETKNIAYVPEFLCEGSALHSIHYPERIVVGSNQPTAQIVSELFRNLSYKETLPVLMLASSEAEAVKLFSNAYLAMRVAFFNELDTFAVENSMDTEGVINGVCLDSRIGNMYNNPSFGYGGYCLPKDTKQLLTNFGQTPQNMFKAIIDANVTRKKYIVTKILEKSPRVVGIYRLLMKKNSNNFRESAVFDIMEELKNKGFEVIVYEPIASAQDFLNYPVIKSLKAFKQHSDVIVANRLEQEIESVKEKIVTRDVFGVS